MAQAEGTIATSSVDLISADHYWIVTITTAIGPGLCFQVFTFVLGAIAEPIQERKTITCFQDGDLYSKVNVAACLAIHDRPDMRLAESDDAIRDASIAIVVKNSLLTD